MGASFPHRLAGVADPSPRKSASATSIGAGLVPVGPTGEAGAPFLSTDSCLIADASTVSSRGFLDAITGRSDAVRAAERQLILERCIRAIRNGNTYGFGPALVAECKQIMAEEDRGWALAERSAWGMSK